MPKKHFATFKKVMTASEFKKFRFHERIWSESFHSSTFPDLQFYLKIFPKGEEQDTDISIFLYCKPLKPIKINYVLYTRNFKKVYTETEWTTVFSKEHKAWGKRRMCPYPDVDKVSDCQKITFGCRLNFHIPDDYDSEIWKSALFRPKTMKERMLELFENGKLCDVVFKVDDEKVYGHTAVIGARSDILAAYFEKKNIFEEKPALVDVISFSSKTVRKGIGFCYTDEIPLDLQTEDLFELYKFARDYIINDLIFAVEAKITEFINARNAVEIGNFAEEIQNSEMQTAANKFISTNLKAVRAIIKNFENLSLKNSHMVLELMSG
ncbi:hypothetical protein FO519_007995 [Halicephalobus sp. NKZ332]|nr:hypothetical protein FO519_007995 [Halicephalobus sp. NKZ332]